MEKDLGAHLVRGLREVQAWDRARERVLRQARDLVRACGSLIRDLHAARPTAAAFRAADAQVRSLLRLVERHPGFRHAGSVQTAFGEYAEARILQAAIRAVRPHPLLGRIPPDALLLGIADAVGELRRRLLDELAAGRLETALTAYDQMERLFGLLARAEPPEALVALRPKRDAARAILERSRGEIVNAKRQKQLEKKIDDLASLLDEAEGRTAKKPKAAASDDLDIDGAWSKT